jgi:hypothetical protein
MMAQALGYRVEDLDAAGLAGGDAVRLSSRARSSPSPRWSAS